MNFLKFITAGNVDDGKSTLLGRLLMDIGKIPLDIVQSVSNKTSSNGEVNLAYITDGLKKEREEGITIDVSYKYFSIKKRKYIIIDAPGHFEYTRNMFTGASNADVILILIDVNLGVTAQTRLHLLLAGMLQIKHIYICVNKMDLTDYSNTDFTKVKDDTSIFAKKNKLKISGFIPISAINGDNVVKKSRSMPWYKGRTLFDILENIKISKEKGLPRAQIQYSLQHGGEFYHFINLISGSLKVKENLQCSPSGKKITLKKILVAGKPAKEVRDNSAVTIQTNDNNLIKRGTYLVSGKIKPKLKTKNRAIICCFDQNGIKNGSSFMLKNGCQNAIANIKIVYYKISGVNLNKNMDDNKVKINEIAQILLEFDSKIAIDTSKNNFSTSKFILVDNSSKNTVAAGYFI